MGCLPSIITQSRSTASIRSQSVSATTLFFNTSDLPAFSPPTTGSVTSFLSLPPSFLALQTPCPCPFSNCDSTGPIQRPHTPRQSRRPLAQYMPHCTCPQSQLAHKKRDGNPSQTLFATSSSTVPMIPDEGWSFSRG